MNGYILFKYVVKELDKSISLSLISQNLSDSSLAFGAQISSFLRFSS